MEKHLKILRALSLQNAIASLQLTSTLEGIFGVVVVRVFLGWLWFGVVYGENSEILRVDAFLKRVLKTLLLCDF